LAGIAAGGAQGKRNHSPADAQLQSRLSTISAISVSLSSGGDWMQPWLKAKQLGRTASFCWSAVVLISV
jgi:hypothetical protein